MKKTLAPVFIFLATIFLTFFISSCRNLLDGSNLREELEKKVDYIKSPDVSIQLIGEQGTVSPSGIQTNKATDRIPLFFSAYPDYQFIKWVIIDPKTNQPFEDETAANEIGVFDDCEKANTVFTLNKIVDHVLTLKAICAERPTPLTTAPLYNPSGVNRDTRIQIMFDHKISEESIYYTAEELEVDILKVLAKQPHNKYDVHFLFDGDAPPPSNVFDITVANKIYGFYLTDRLLNNKRNSDSITYKNIKIIAINNNKNENLLSHYEKPYFEGADLLIIPTKTGNSSVPEFSQPLVSIENFFYFYSYENENGETITTDKKITMAEPEKWNYHVNNTTDTTNPEIKSIKITNVTGTPLPENRLTAIPVTLSDRKLYIDTEVTDANLDETFTITLNKLYDEFGSMLANQTTTSLSASYTSMTDTKQDAVFKSAIDLSDLADGIYRVTLSFTDKTGNKTEKTGAIFKLEKPIVTFEYDSSTNILTATADTWTNSAPDLKWQLKSPTLTKTISATKSYNSSTGKYKVQLTNASVYSAIILKQYDENSNVLSFPYTMPTQITDFSVVRNPEHPNTQLDLSWTTPVSNAGTTKIMYSISDISNATVSSTKNISNLTPGKEYHIWIVQEIKNSSTSSTIGSTISRLITKESCYTAPNAVTGLASTSEPTSITISWTKPTGNFTGYAIYYIANNSRIPRRLLYIEDPSATSYTISNLSTRTKYAISIQSYYIDKTNISLPQSIEAETYPILVPFPLK